MKLYANLHSHSTHSDGKYSPTELVQVAKAEGYGAIAVTDHDTATGYPELKAECDRLGMDCIFGVEFSSPSTLRTSPEAKPECFHIVGFHFDPEYPPMKEYLAGMSARETDQTQILFERGVREGQITGITWEEVLEYNKSITWLCNEHVFRAMKAKGLVVDADYPRFFDEIFGPRRDEVPPSYPFKQAEEIIQLIRDAGGIAVLAHPHKQLCFVDALMEMGLEGIEVWHPDLTEEECKESYKIALEKGLYISGGSDHSGLCGGLYDSYDDPKTCPYYIPELSAGTTLEYYNEIKNRKINR